MKIKYLIIIIAVLLYSCATDSKSSLSGQENAHGDVLLWQSSSVSAKIKKPDIAEQAEIDLPEIQKPSFISLLPDHFRMYFSKGYLLLPEPELLIDTTAQIDNSSENLSAENPLPQPDLPESRISDTEFASLFPSTAYKSFLPEDIILEAADEEIKTSEKKQLTKSLAISQPDNSVSAETVPRDNVDRRDGKRNTLNHATNNNSDPAADPNRAFETEDDKEIENLVLWNRNSGARIILNGKNWYFIFADKPRLISFEKRFLDGNDSVFLFQPKKEGMLRLLFRRQDLYNEEQEEKYIDVLIGPELASRQSETEDSTKIKDETGSNPAEPAATIENNTKTADTEQVPELMDLSAYNGMTKAEILLIIARFTDAGLISEAIQLSEYAYTKLFPEEFNDDFLWILGQLHELEGSEKDLRKAIYYYGQLVELYPFSVHYKDAEGRAGYLERFHIYFK